MKRLDFRLHEFTRLCWVSEPARDAWAPRIKRIAAAWQEAEWRSVACGLRQAAHLFVSPEALPPLSQKMAKEGLLVSLLGEVGTCHNAYQSVQTTPQPGQPFLHRVGVCRPPDAAGLSAAFRAGDEEATGRYLGYPVCCTRFFLRVWVKERFIDTTWPMAAATAGGPNDDGDDGRTDIFVDQPPEANLLLRWLGVRPVFHLPCRFDCPATIEVGKRLIALLRELGSGQEADWLRSMLSWPIEWSACHGIAEIKTPVVKIIACTDATAGMYKVRYAGRAYPAEGAQGLGFPYRQPGRLRVLQSESFQRGLKNPICAS